MNEEEFDVVEFTDEDGNQLLLEVVDSFFYNGDEFAVLTEWEAGDDEHECDCGCAEHKHGEDHVHVEGHVDEANDEEENLYIMKINTFVNDEGEEMEEFIPVEDSMMETLIEIVQTRFFDDDDEETDDEETEEVEDQD